MEEVFIVLIVCLIIILLGAWCCRAKQKEKSQFQPKRLFGDFECRCGNQWSSAWSWRIMGEKMGQKCRRCHDMVYPHKQSPLEFSSSRPGEEPHKSDLCDMCERVGRDCREATQAEMEAALC